MVTEDRSNVAPEVQALLASAREHYYKGIESHRAAADAIIEARNLDPKLSLRDIARALGIHHKTVSTLLTWRSSGADRATSPFGGDHSRLERAVRQAIREKPEALVEEILRDPDLLDRIMAEADARSEADEGPEHETEPAEGPPVLWPWDTVVMGEHVLVVHDSTKPHAKLLAATAAGLPHLREFYDPLAIEDSSGDGEMNVVVITDQPYGQDKEGITNDHRANWGETYQLFKPKGGFVFCAFHPPLFRKAEDGIIEAGGTPVYYLAMDKGGGRLWGERLQNRADSIIYFERNEQQPWKAGRHAVSVLRPSRSHAAIAERKEIGGAHPTVKYVDILIQLIELSTEPGDIVLDPFTGSGTTLIACERTGRRFIGIEFEPEWADLTVRNWQTVTGRDAIVHPEFADPVSFNDLAADPSLHSDAPDL